MCIRDSINAEYGEQAVAHMSSPALIRSPPGNTVDRFNRLQKVVQDMGGAHQDMDFMSKQRKVTIDQRFNVMEDQLRDLTAALEALSADRAAAEQRLRKDVEERIGGVEQRMEAEMSKQGAEMMQSISGLQEKVSQITGSTDSDKEEVHAALTKVRRDIEVTCETLLEEQMKLRGKVNEEFQAVHERLTEEGQLREASEERTVEALEGVSAYFAKGVDLIR
eukprot:TRINITY_DN16532_c0_g1_i4.p1 TRINITY_DN16532_c0_g1~~TRINITY_DN16532_c0_g1_i4.p1  ORF type:complete len:221 (+),score=79.48 TRINITY_DN16532_c0_g1_i4:155-817(+)